MPIAFNILILILSVVVHEVAHGFSAYYLGDPTAKFAGRLTLNPLRHLDPFGSLLVPLITYQFGFIFGWAKPVPYNPYNLRAGRWGGAIVAVAGPIANLFLAACFSVIIWLSVGLAPAVFIQLAAAVVLINLMLALFNLIPVPPLDGSKILFALIPYRYRRVEEILTRYQLFWAILAITFVAPLLLPVVTAIFQLGTGLPI